MDEFVAAEAEDVDDKEDVEEDEDDEVEGELVLEGNSYSTPVFQREKVKAEESGSKFPSPFLMLISN